MLWVLKSLIETVLLSAKNMILLIGMKMNRILRLFFCTYDKCVRVVCVCVCALAGRPIF